MKFIKPVLISISACGIAVMFITLNFGKEVIDISFENKVENDMIITNLIEYDIIKSYDSSIPFNVSKTVVEGEIGLSFSNDLGETITLKEPINEQIVIGTGKESNHTGIMTAYGPDCSTCDGRGYTACDAPTEGWYNLLTDGVFYEDLEYGEARVLAADLSYFPCGTIIEVDSTNAGKFIGIVLDTGYDMRKNFENGIIHFDVAFETEKDPEVYNMTNTKSVNFNVQRWGF